MEEEQKVRRRRPSLVHFSHHRVEVKNLQQRCGRLPSPVCSPLHTCTGSPASRERVQLQHLSTGALLKGALLQRTAGEAPTVSTVGKMVLIPASVRPPSAQTAENQVFCLELHSEHVRSRLQRCLGGNHPRFFILNILWPLILLISDAAAVDIYCKTDNLAFLTLS